MPISARLPCPQHLMMAGEWCFEQIEWIQVSRVTLLAVVVVVVGRFAARTAHLERIFISRSLAMRATRTRTRCVNKKRRAQHTSHTDGARATCIPRTSYRRCECEYVRVYIILVMSARKPATIESGKGKICTTI